MTLSDRNLVTRNLETRLETQDAAYFLRENRPIDGIAFNSQKAD